MGQSFLPNGPRATDHVLVSGERSSYYNNFYRGETRIEKLNIIKS